MPRRAKSLATLLEQANKLAPNRSKTIGPDGWIGDPAHAARKSDHNPNSKGVVQAQDISHDPAGGFDSYKFADTLRINKDPRIKYVISAGKWFKNYGPTPWLWVPYTGKNAHRQHVHVSVSDDEDLYDDPRPWVLAGGPVKSAPTETTPPTLWKGASGDPVKRVQNYLGVKPVDGKYGPQTEKAVREFQKKAGLVVDGVVGPNTWLALATKMVVAAAPIPRQKGIVATVFGGSIDNYREKSAYDGSTLDSNGYYVALPYRFSRPPLVRVFANGKSVLTRVMDVGPLYTDDPYWLYGSRPLAEKPGLIVRGPNKGKKSNRAGIDLSLAVAKALGLTGDPKVDKVDWEEEVTA